ncbi:MAG: carbohydrate kinase family protein [Pseudoflavonifractor sp.]
MTRAYDILGIGDADIDLMVAVKNFPEAGQKSSGRLLGRFPGGMVANFLAAAATFGAGCSGVLCVGDDAFGQETLADLSARGVHVGKSVIRKGESTYFTTTCLAPDGEKRMILCFGGAVYPAPGEIDDLTLASARYIQMTGSHTKLTIPVATRAKALGTKISFDLERLQSPMEEDTRDTLLSLADIIFPNEEGLYSYSGCTDLERGARALLQKGPEVVVVTKGAQGAEVFTADTHCSVPAFAVKVADTTGAGDTFNGAFLAALCREYTLRDCALLAGAAAAMQITAVGSRTRLSTEAQIRAFLHEHKIQLESDV